MSTSSNTQYQQSKLNLCKIKPNRNRNKFLQMPVTIKSINSNEFQNLINSQNSSCYNNYYSSTSLPSTSATLPTGSNTTLNTPLKLTKNQINTSSSSSASAVIGVSTSSPSKVVQQKILGIGRILAQEISNANSYQNQMSMDKKHLILNGSSSTSSSSNGVGSKTTVNRNSDSAIVIDSIKVCINNLYNKETGAININTLKNSDILKNIQKDKSTDKNNLINKPVASKLKNNVDIFSEIIDITNESENKFINGMDVLVQKKDSKYYLGTIIAVYPKKSKCLVKFDDNSEYCAEYMELTVLGSKTNEFNNQPMCVICKKFNANDIVELCETCGRGCHRLCAEGGYKNGIWTCTRCTTANGEKSMTNKSNSMQLPYDLNALNWDDKHRVNEEQIYCYCGKTGMWEKKMLQCIKCLQWFHDNCIDCIDNPVYNGDRFYIFYCSICNNGEEFLRRLEMKWVDIVHLIVYNLTTNNQDKKYHHVTKEIIPYAVEHWSSLQLQSTIKNLSTNEVKENIMKTLTMYKTRFKSGREIKKNNLFWGLRCRIPPTPPRISIPHDIQISDEYLKNNLKINIIPSQSQPHYLRKSDRSLDVKCNDDLKISPEKTISMKTTNTKDKDKKNKGNTVKVKLNPKTSTTKTNIKSSVASTLLTNTVKTSINKTNNVEATNTEKINSIKSSSRKTNVTSSNVNKSSTEKSQISTRSSTNNNDEKRNILTLTKQNKILHFPRIPIVQIKKLNTMDMLSLTSNLTAKKINICDSLKKNSPLGPLDLLIPPPKNFKGCNNPFYITPKKNETKYNNLNLIKNNHIHRQKNFDINAKLTSLKKANSIFKNAEFITVRNFQAAGQSKVTKPGKRRLSGKDAPEELNTNSKKRQKLNQENGKTLEVKNQNSIKTPVIALKPPVNTTPISNNVPLAEAAVPNKLKTVEKPIQIESTISCRNLRKRQEKNYSENSRRNSNSSIGTISSNASANNIAAAVAAAAAASISAPRKIITKRLTSLQKKYKNDCTKTPTTTTAAISATTSNIDKTNSQPRKVMTDLQSSVNKYFGAVERIKKGEKFTVKGKRKLLDGEIQYLIDWETGGMSTVNH